MIGPKQRRMVVLDILEAMMGITRQGVKNRMSKEKVDLLDPEAVASWIVEYVIDLYDNELSDGE